jgi:hypothetical protein
MTLKPDSGYRVITATNIIELAETVEDRKAQGWKLQGGVSIAMRFNDRGDMEGIMYAQAMDK